MRSFLAPACAFLVASMGLTGCGGNDPPVGGSSGGSSGSSEGGSGTDSGSSGHAGGGGTSNDAGGTFTSPLPTKPKTGVATYYDYSGGSAVACSFDITADTNITALNDGEYATSAACGSCLTVVGPKGVIKVRVVDRCPGCAGNHIDLSAQAFAKIADPIAGRVPITYEVVPCDVPNKMSYRFKEGSSKFWTAIQVRDHRLPITSLEYLKSGVYTNMPRSEYNYFIASKGVGDQPSGLTLRLTAADGQTIEETLPEVQPSVPT